MRPGSLSRVASVILSLLLMGCMALCAGCSSGKGGTSSSSSSSVSASSAAASSSGSSNSSVSASSSSEVTVTKDGTYTSKEEVALYIHTYGKLPSNFISKTKATAAGWDSSKGNLADVCPGKSIGGSRYYNDDGALPEANGRTYTECDINYVSGYRGAERIIFSNDGLIFYTDDHYQTFEQLY